MQFIIIIIIISLNDSNLMLVKFSHKSLLFHPFFVWSMWESIPEKILLNAL